MKKVSVIALLLTVAVASITLYINRNSSDSSLKRDNEISIIAKSGMEKSRIDELQKENVEETAKKP